MIYKIEKNIPIPRRSGGSTLINTLKAMKRGDSLMLGKYKTRSAATYQYRQHYRVYRKLAGKKFTGRVMQQNKQHVLRIWRTK